jgi:predicted RNase H-like HicB family nuclease
MILRPPEEAAMTYKVELIRSEDGYSVSCPSLPGCASQGETEEEAIENIRSAISEYLTVVKEIQEKEPVEKKVMFVDVSVAGSEQGRLSSARTRPFKVTPIPMSLPPFTKVEDLLDQLEGTDRR